MRWAAAGTERQPPLGRPSGLSSSPGSSLTRGMGTAGLPISGALPPHADASMHRVRGKNVRMLGLRDWQLNSS